MMKTQRTENQAICLEDILIVVVHNKETKLINEFISLDFPEFIIQRQKDGLLKIQKYNV